MAAAASMSLRPFSPSSNVIRGRGKFPPRGTRLGGFTFRVKSQAEDQTPEKEQANPNPSLPPPPPPKPAVRTGFYDVLAFSGPAPERINGRLAMVGFVAALGAEVASGESLLAQLNNGGLPWFLGVTVVLSIASLVPLFRGVSVQSRSGGVMTSEAELWNGRFAMLGMVALVFAEYLKGSALV